MGTVLLVCGRLMWQWNRNLSKVVVEKLAKARKLKRSQRRKQRGCSRWRNGEMRGSSACLYHWKRISFSFPNIDVCVNIQKIYISNGLYGHNFTFATTPREPSFNTREFCSARGTTIKFFLLSLWKHLCLNPFSQGEWKRLVDPMALYFMVNGVWLLFHLWIAMSDDGN